MKGLLISIEGTDGSGKGTQSKRIAEFYSDVCGFNVKLISFPCYDSTFFGSEIGKYLNGEFGELSTINPKFSSLLFALDRFEKAKEIKQYLDQGYIVICDRYVDSNVAYQCSLLETQNERIEMEEWLRCVEYQVLELPKPDVTLFLDVEPVVSRKMVHLKDTRTYTENKEDLLESSHNLIENSYKAYRKMAKQYNWIIIACTEKQQMYSSNKISSNILTALSEYIVEYTNRM